jgi:WD40 repeat protein
LKAEAIPVEPAAIDYNQLQPWQGLLVDGALSSLAIAPDRKLLAGADAAKVLLWNTGGGDLVRTLEGHTGRVLCVTFAPDGKTIATGSADKTARVWSVETGDLLHTLTGHTGDVNCIAYSSDGKLLATGSEDKTVRLWNAATAQTVHTMQHAAYPVTAIAFAPDGKTLFSGQGTQPFAAGKVALARWNIPEGTQQGEREMPNPNLDRGLTVFAADGKTMAMGLSTQTSEVAKLWNGQTGEFLRTIKLPDPDMLNKIHSITLSPDGKTLAAGWGDNSVKLWDTKSGKLFQELQTGDELVTAVTFSPDGKVLAAASGGRTVQLWRVP